jgi:hypothetical protein
MPNTYEIDTTIELMGTFANALTGAAVDPTDVTLFIRDPEGDITQHANGQLTRVGVGVYTFLITVSVHGVWTYKWQGTGAVVVTSPDTALNVNQSIFISG